jgi:hypothetical protein
MRPDMVAHKSQYRDHNRMSRWSNREDLKSNMGRAITAGGRVKKIYFWAIPALMLLGTLEILTFSGLQLVMHIRPWLFREDFVAHHFGSLTDNDFLRFKRGRYDPLLGWDNRPNGTERDTNSAGRLVVASYAFDGARRDGLPGKANLIATYGDSFTACAEVNDDETWQFYLEKQLVTRLRILGWLATAQIRPC